VLQMRGGGYADVLPVLQVPDNKADAVPCERLQNFIVSRIYIKWFCSKCPGCKTLKSA